VGDKHSGTLLATGSVIVTAGGAFMAVVALEPSTKPRPIWANDWFVAGFALVMLGLLIAIIGLYLHFRREPAPSRELASRAQALSRELYDFLAERRRDDRTLESHLRSSGTTGQERHQRWIEYTTSSQAFSTETMSRYGQRYAAHALAIFDAAAEAGLADLADRWCFMYPTNPLGIEHVAQGLGVIGHKAEDSA
jgi:hypothetical protein